jgi:hypothetical protein
MIDDPAQGMPEILSAPRFDRYLKATGGDRVPAVRLYQSDQR